MSAHSNARLEGFQRPVPGRKGQRPRLPQHQNLRDQIYLIARYHPPLPPLQRVLAHAEVDEVSKTRLRALYAQADPVLLLAEVRAAQAVLGERVDRRGTQTAPPQPIIVDPARFAASLKTAWCEGEQRAIAPFPYGRERWRA